MTDLSKTIEPKSDQLNADDLITGEKTITITKVSSVSGDQPIAIYFEGDNKKPYKPCKSMRRLLVQIWGSDGNRYVGRSLTLFLDQSVTWAGQAVGGIRVSHMSHIEKEITVLLTSSKGNKKPCVIKPLIIKDDKSEKAVSWVESVSDEIMKLLSLEEINKFKADKSKLIDGVSKYKKANELLNDIFTNCLAQLPDETEGDK